MGLKNIKFFLKLSALSVLFLFVFSGSIFANEGIQYYKNKDYKKALAELQQAIRENPKDFQSHYYLGLTYGKLDQHHQAERSLKKAIELNPNLTSAYLSLGINQYKIKSYDSALKTFDQALQANPKDGTAYFFQGLSHQGKGDYRKAIPAFQKSRDLSENFRQLSLFNIGLSYFKLDDNENADKYFQQTIDEDPNADISQTSRKFKKTIADRNKKEKRWSLEASVGFEYDDNVTSGQQDLVTGGEDHAIIYELEGEFKLFKYQNFEAEISYDFFQRLFQEELFAFDYQSHSPGISFVGRFGKVTTNLSYRYSRSWLGEVDFLQLHILTPSVGISWSPRIYTHLSYMFMDKEFQQASNDARDGTNHSIAISQFLFFMKNKAYFMASYRWGDEDTFGSQFVHEAHTINLGVKLPGPFKTKLRLNYKYVMKDYENITPSIGDLREDDKRYYRAELTREFLDHLRLTAKYEYIDSDSNLRSIIYTENIFYFGLTAFF
jgi:tetratricopeptide (TPR) repeat protein